MQKRDKLRSIDRSDRTCREGETRRERNTGVPCGSRLLRNTQPTYQWSLGVSVILPPLPAPHCCLPSFVLLLLSSPLALIVFSTQLPPFHQLPSRIHSIMYNAHMQIRFLLPDEPLESEAPKNWSGSEKRKETNSRARGSGKKLAGPLHSPLVVLLELLLRAGLIVPFPHRPQTETNVIDCKGPAVLLRHQRTGALRGWHLHSSHAAHKLCTSTRGLDKHNLVGIVKCRAVCLCGTAIFYALLIARVDCSFCD
mmetsp:Transcript_38422/g.75432  ORF Transcript_38422/g.75432 Transcript_38422/m.75432 type:complete len:253 (+) Transcript_38422:536-1294(+)